MGFKRRKHQTMIKKRVREPTVARYRELAYYIETNSGQVKVDWMPQKGQGPTHMSF